jgi:D-ribulokinase
MLGAVAGGAHGSIGETMASMSALGSSSEPTAAGMAEFHRGKRRVYNRLRALDRESRVTMRAVQTGFANAPKG